MPIDIDGIAGNPKTMQGDQGMIEEQPLPDLIAADEYQKANAAVAGGKSAWGCLRPARAVLPSAVGPRSPSVQ